MKQLKRFTALFLVVVMLLSCNVYAVRWGDGSVPSDDAAVNAPAVQRDKNSLPEAQPNEVTTSACMIKNEYIEFYVNNYGSDSGKFTIGNVEGNPNFTSDNNKILLYGHPSPWSSFTTIRVDGSNYYFRADETVYDTEELTAVSTMTIDGVVITQTLKIIHNDGTGLEDTVRISYKVENQSDVSKNVGVRIMLDTMLGSNDGAPFKVPSLGNVTTEKELTGDEIPAYWQAFDDLENATVFAVGSFYRLGDRKPDKVQFAYWRYITNSMWDYEVGEYTSLTHDSAVAVYWNPVTLVPGEITRVSTYYGVGYSSDSSSSTGGSAQVPSDGFVIQVIDNNGDPVRNATVEATNIPGCPSATTDNNGLAFFDVAPEGEGEYHRVYLNVTRSGYHSVQDAVRYVRRGGLAAVTVYSDNGQLYVTSVVGEIEGTSVDLLADYKYFSANSSDIEAAEDGRNVKNFTIKVSAVGGDTISRYQLLQGGAIVAESTNSTITIPVLTGTPEEPDRFGSSWRITQLKSGQIVYLRVVDEDGTVSNMIPLGIRVSEPVLHTAGNSSGSLNFGEELTITVPSNIPIIGDTEIKLGWNGLPFIFEISDSGKVKFAVNPKTDPFEFGRVDGTNLSNWDEVEREFDDAMEQVGLGRASAASAFGGTPEPFGAGKLSVEAGFMGYGEGYVDENGNIIVELGLVVTISEEGSYTWTYFLGYVPVYVSVGEKVELIGKGSFNVIRSNGRWDISGAVGEINPKITLNIDGGVGINGVLNVGASGRATLSWVNRWTDNYNRVDLTGEMYIVAKAFLFSAEKKLASDTWTIYDSYNRSALSVAALSGVNFYDTSSYKPIDRSYLFANSSLSTDGNAVKENIYPDANPTLVQVGDVAYLFWMDDIVSRAANDRTALVYATSEDGENWSAPVQLIAETGNSTADFDYDVFVDGTKVHIVLSKANARFDVFSATLDQMAASSEIYYACLNTVTGEVTEWQQITDNEYADVMPVVAVVDGQVMVAYVENALEDGLFGTNNTFSICVKNITTGEQTVDVVSGMVTEMNAGILGENFAVSYILDQDMNYDTANDTQLCVVVNRTNAVVIGEPGVSNPTFAEIGGANVLLWYANGNIFSLQSADGTPTTLFDKPIANLSQSFYVINGAATKIVWEAMSGDKLKCTTAVYATEFDGYDWTDAYLVFETNSELSSVLSGYSGEAYDYIAYLKTTGVEYDTPATTLCVAVAEGSVDIAILDVAYEMSDVAPGANLPLTVTVQNCGATDVDSFDVWVDGEYAGTIWNADLARGETKVYEVDGYVVPSWLSEVRKIDVSLSAEGDLQDYNDLASIQIGYADVSVDTQQMLINGDDCVNIILSNDSGIPADVTLRIIADEKDGAVLYEASFYELTGETTNSLVVNLNELTDRTNVKVFYVVVTTNAEEITSLDNQKIIYLGVANNDQPVVDDLSGTCGEDLNWTLASDGTLIIRGEGAMDNYSAGSAPWYAHASEITAVVLPEEITSIGNYAFYGCDQIVTVTFLGSRVQWEDVVIGEGNDLLQEIRITFAGVILGDVNDDGEVTGADTNLIFRYVSGTIELTEEQKEAADVNGDGEVTGADTNLVFRYVSGTLESLG